ncbi:MAG: hypothetical protein HYX24_00775 [Candidatus Aenigmarchaeota archaeon]|nr:hypothetical protein [Candidatus Aenigmarchaeota archaeon]
MAQFKIGDVLEHHDHNQIVFKGDALNVAKERGWLLEFSEGQFVYAEDLTRYFKAFQQLFRDEVACPLNFAEWILPRLLPQEILEKFGSVQFVPRSLFEVKQFYERPDKRKNYFLDTVQSASLYYALAKTPLNDEKLPLRVFETIGGYQWRNERGEELHGFDKLYEYLKMEHVYVGFPKQVVESRRKQAEKYKTLFRQLGLNFRIVVGAPCHVSPKNSERYEKAQNLDEIPLLDFEFEIPYEDRWLEVCGACVEEDENTQSFGIQARSGEKLWSGCSGVGLNRLVYAYLAQHGFDPNSYPPKFRAYLEQ